MAKKKRTRNSFNMAAEIRSLLQSDSNMSGKDVYSNLQAKYPNETVNEASCLVAYSNARSRLGLGGKNKSARKTGGPKAIDMEALKAAQQYIAEIGDAETAIKAIQQLTSLQISS